MLVVVVTVVAVSGIGEESANWLQDSVFWKWQEVVGT